MTDDQQANLEALAVALANFLAGAEPRPRHEPTPRAQPDRVLLTCEEAAERLGIGRTLMFQLVKQGDVDSVLIGRLRRIPVEALNDYARQLLAQQSPKRVA